MTGSRKTRTELRWARPEDQPAIRAFLEAVGFVVRPPQTWSALGMSAATAWRDGRLLGAIPLEPRRLKVGAACCLRCLQQTTVAVDPALRGQGIGSALQDFIADRVGDQADALAVYREEPESAGYRWYRSNGFQPVQRLWIWSRRAASSDKAELPLKCEPWDAPDVPLAKFEALRQNASAQSCGLAIPREDRPLVDWLPVHPYVLARRFEIAWQAEPLSYALLGRAEDGSVDILEIESEATGRDALEDLLTSLCHSAASRGSPQFRMMLAESDDAAIAAVQAAGFERLSSMNLLMKPLAAGLSLDFDAADRSRWRHQAIDYV